MLRSTVGYELGGGRSSRSFGAVTDHALAVREGLVCSTCTLAMLVLQEGGVDMGISMGRNMPPAALDKLPLSPVTAWLPSICANAAHPPPDSDPGRASSQLPSSAPCATGP